MRVPRERFVRLEDVAVSWQDRALPLDEGGAATISALHAYAASFRALELGPGDALVDLGGGSGYGASIAAEIVGPEGHVTVIECDPALVRLAAANLAARGNVEVVEGDAHAVERWRGASKVVVGFALAELPAAWVDALADGGSIVAPVGPPDEQELVRLDKRRGEARVRVLGRVRYVPDRSAHG